MNATNPLADLMKSPKWRYTNQLLLKAKLNSDRHAAASTTDLGATASSDFSKFSTHYTELLLHKIEQLAKFRAEFYGNLPEMHALPQYALFSRALNIAARAWWCSLQIATPIYVQRGSFEVLEPFFDKPQEFQHDDQVEIVEKRDPSKTLAPIWFHPVGELLHLSSRLTIFRELYLPREKKPQTYKGRFAKIYPGGSSAANTTKHYKREEELTSQLSLGVRDVVNDITLPGRCDLLRFLDETLLEVSPEELSVELIALLMDRYFQQHSPGRFPDPNAPELHRFELLEHRLHALHQLSLREGGGIEATYRSLRRLCHEAPSAANADEVRRLVDCLFRLDAVFTDLEKSHSPELFLHKILSLPLIPPEPLPDSSYKQRKMPPKVFRIPPQRLRSEVLRQLDDNSLARKVAEQLINGLSSEQIVDIIREQLPSGYALPADAPQRISERLQNWIEIASRPRMPPSSFAWRVRESLFERLDVPPPISQLLPEKLQELEAELPKLEGLTCEKLVEVVRTSDLLERYVPFALYSVLMEEVHGVMWSIYRVHRGKVSSPTSKPPEAQR